MEQEIQIKIKIESENIVAYTQSIRSLTKLHAFLEQRHAEDGEVRELNATIKDYENRLDSAKNRLDSAKKALRELMSNAPRARN